MRHGGSTQRRGRGGRSVALALVSVLVLASCQQGDDTAAGGTPVAMADPAAEPLQAPLTWDDGLDHLLVTTEPVSVAPAASPAPPDVAPTAPATTVADAASGSGTVLIDHADGTSIERSVPDGALTFIQPSTEAQRTALATAAADGAVAVLVQDRAGLIGDVDAVYVLTPGHLAEVSSERHALMSTAAVPVTVAADDGAVAADVDASGDPVLDELRAAAGVVSAERVAPDLVAVATGGPTDVIATLPGVLDVGDDILLGLADDERQHEEWWLQNLGQTDQTSGWPAVAGADANAIAGWQVSKGAGTVVAVIDTGVSIDHPDLASQIWNNPGEVCANGVDDDGNGRVDDCHGYDFGANDTDPRPDVGAQSTEHGTHVAGIIGAAQNGIGIAGIAPQSTIMPVKVSTTTGALGLGAIVAGIRYAADEGAKVMNLSLSTGPNTPRSAMSAFESAIAYAQSKGVLVVVAAGNDNYDIGAGPAWPANYSLYYDNVLTVGATTPSDQKASFSNYGSPVELWAPGWFILSTVLDGKWNWLSGTSMAAPVVAGAAADVIASGQVLAPSAVRDRLVARADQLAVGPRLDLGAALGVDLPASVQVTYGGADALVADTDATLGIDLVGSSLPAGTDRVRVSVAASTNGDVYAVGDLAATFRTPDGITTAAVTGDDGSFAPVTVTDVAALATGYHLDLLTNLPAGDFAIVTELLDANGTTVASPQVGFVSVAAAPGAPTTTVAAPDTPAPDTPAPDTPAPDTPGPGTTAPADGGTATTQPVTSQPGSQPGTTQPVTTQPVTSQPGTTTPTAPGTTAPATTAPRSPSTSAPASPVTTAAPGTTTPAAPGTTAPATTAPRSPSTSAPASPVTTTAPATTAPRSPSTTAPSSPVSTVAPVTTLPAAPGTTQPVTTTPAPPPDVSGPWRLDAASPRSGTVQGGERITLQGHFPTTVPVYVWFGQAVAQGTSVTGTSVDVVAPAVATAGVVDLSVRFTTTTSHVLTLTGAYTYVASPTTTVPAPGTTAPATPGTTAPGTTAPAPGTTAPATTAPTASTTPAIPTTTLPPRLGNLSLRARPTVGSLSRLTISSWRTPCRAASCPAAAL